MEGTWQRKMRGSPASQAPESRPGGFPGLDPLSTSIPSPPPGTLLTALHFRMTLGMSECVCVCVCVCVHVWAGVYVAVHASPSLTCLKNHHTGVKKGDGLQLPGTVRHPPG